MKITTGRSGDVTHTTIEWVPMSTERFEAVCKLVELAIGGAVLLGAGAPVGFWAIPYVAGAYTLAGGFRLLKNGF